MTTTRFFMVGSWTEGMFHFEKLRSHVLSVQPGQIQSRLFRLPVGYPVLVADSQKPVGSITTFQHVGLDQTARIDGQVLEIKTDATLIALIDTFHGVHPTHPEKSLFHRHEVEFSSSNGESITAIAYLMNPAKLPKGATEITGQCWRQMLAEVPPLPAQLTPRQVEVVKQLGQAKGRDVVLVKDLTLYRELMKLELIVDKGRRLALSPLGKDVFKYLA